MKQVHDCDGLQSCEPDRCFSRDYSFYNLWSIYGNGSIAWGQACLRKKEDKIDASTFYIRAPILVQNSYWGTFQMELD